MIRLYATQSTNSRHVVRLGRGLVALLLAGLLAPISARAARPEDGDPGEFRTEGLLAGKLAGPLKDVQEVVFAVRGRSRDYHWYANFGYYCMTGDNCFPKGYTDKKPYGAGPGRLCALNLRTGNVRTLLEDREGGVRDPAVSYDGKRILFSYRKGGTDHYHLYEINADGTGLRQLTDGDVDDIEPIYLPNGDIVFESSRCYRWVPCWVSQVAITYRCDADGGNIRCISTATDHENTPWMMPDGRVLYMKWEYVERHATTFHHLWTFNPDGSGAMIYYGNTPTPGNVAMVDAKPIPGTDDVVATWSIRHGCVGPDHSGHIMRLSPARGPDARQAERRVDRCPPPGTKAPWWRDPYPISDDCYLVAALRSLYVMDGRGRFEEIHTLDGEGHTWLHEPRPLVARPREPIIPDRWDDDATHGEMILADLFTGRNVAGLGDVEIDKLLVLEVLPKSISTGWSEDAISLGSTFFLERVLGTVPVEEDGSAYFRVPAMRPVFFAALDGKGRVVKKMHSSVSVVPGETLSCVGCHEQRTRTGLPIAANTLRAVRRSPSEIEPFQGVPEIFDFPRDIQPILDKHCVSCHNYDKHAGGVALTGDRGPIFSHAYYNLMRSEQVRNNGQGPGNRGVYEIGSGASPLMDKIDGSHHDVTLSKRERRMIRLWIDSGSVYAGTYAALGSGSLYMGTHAGPRYDHPQLRLPLDVLESQCWSCHVSKRDIQRAAKKNRQPWPRDKRGDSWINLTRPEKSLMLLAPLAKKDGGLGLCRRREAFGSQDQGSAAPPAPVFASKRDPHYRKLLASIRAGKATLDRIKRFDMPRFVPNAHYLREMKRCGALPTDWTPGEPIDPYRIDEAYYRLFWHVPGRLTKRSHRPQAEQRLSSDQLRQPARRGQ